MRVNRINQQACLEFVCCCILSGALVYFVQSQKYLSYVTPRMKPYLYFTSLILLIWNIVSLPKLIQPQHKVRVAHCFILVIPILFLLLPHGSLNTSNLAANYVQGSAFSNMNISNTYQPPLGSSSEGGGETDASTFEDDDVLTDDTYSLTESSLEGSQATSDESISADSKDTQAVNSDNAPSVGLPGLDTVSKRITVSNDDYVIWLTELSVNMKKYQGYTVVMTGFVYKDSEINGDDEFAIARLMMTCCAADLSPAGFLCHYNNANELEENSWVTIEGTLFIGSYEFDGVDYDDPQISITKVTPTDEVEGYVYPLY